jgi:hypothetical protein
MKTRCRRGTWSSSEYRGRARVAHAVAHDELVVHPPVAESTDPPRGLKRTWLATLKEVQFHEQR